MSNNTTVPFSVGGKTAIVTGAGSGINYAFAKLLLSKNCNVVLADITLRPEAAGLLERYTGNPKALFHKTDVTSWSDLSSLFQVTCQNFGTFDIVCPGAGIFEPLFSNFWFPPTGVSSTSPSKDPISGLGHYATLDINITHPIRATQLAIAEFLQPSDGSAKASSQNPKRVIHIASIASRGAAMPIPMYIASKRAIDGFVRSLASIEDTLGIRVNAVSPAIVRTPLWTDDQSKLQMFDEAKDEWTTPEEVAEVMISLLEDPENVGGTVIEVNHEQTTVVPMYGYTRPEGKGTTLGFVGKSSDDAYASLAVSGWGKIQSK